MAYQIVCNLCPFYCLPDNMLVFLRCRTHPKTEPLVPKEAFMGNRSKCPSNLRVTLSGEIPSEGPALKRLYDHLTLPRAHQQWG